MSMSRPPEVCQRTHSSEELNTDTAKRTNVEKATTVMVSIGRKRAARKKNAIAAIVHHRGIGQPPARAKVRNSSAASAATMAANAVTIQSLPKKTRAATSAMSTIAVRMRFMCLVEDTWLRGLMSVEPLRRICLRSDVLLTDYNFFAFGDPYCLVRRKGGAA